jgi:hypothetical protein
MSEKPIHMQDRIPSTQKISILLHKQWGNNKQGAETKLRKDIQNRLRKEFTQTQKGKIQNNAEGLSWNVTETLYNDNINNKHTDWLCEVLLWAELASLF